MKKIFNILVLSLLFIGCEDVIELDVPEGPEKLVVDALLTDGDSLQTVTLSRSSAYFESSQTPRVSGAKVHVITSNNDTIQFIEDTLNKGDYNAIYEMSDTTLRFTLYIETSNGKKYKSFEEALYRVPPIDSLKQGDEKLPPQGDFQKGGYEGLLSTIEPKGMGDYYRWIIKVNGEKLLDPFSLVFTDDRLVDGNPILDWPIVNELLEGDTVEIHQMSMSDRAYHYWTLIFNQITNFGGPFTTPPAPIEGNMVCTSDPDELVLGFFGVSRVSIATLQIVPK